MLQTKSRLAIPQSQSRLKVAVIQELNIQIVIEPIPRARASTIRHRVNVELSCAVLMMGFEGTIPPFVSSVRSILRRRPSRAASSTD